MFELGPASLGLLLLIIGFVVLLLIILLMRIKSRDSYKANERNSFHINVDIPTNKDALFIVESGGKISYINDQARDFFVSINKHPNLDQLSYQSRPKDTFLRLCATEGKARFSINNRVVEGTSYQVPSNGKKATIVTLSPQENETALSVDATQSNQAIEIINELSQAVSPDLDLESTLVAILKSVEQQVPFDFSLISLQDSKIQSQSTFLYRGSIDKPRKLEIFNEQAYQNKGYINHLINQSEPLLITDVGKPHDFRPDIDRRKYPYQSYVGMPLFISDQLIGILEFFSLSTQAFTSSDASILKSISNPVAIAINTALVYKEEQRRTIEISSLATLSRAIGSVDDSTNLYAKLVQSITPLLDVEIAGFLVFNKSQRRIEAQWPFFGLPENFIELYQIQIPLDSPAEEIWLSKEPIITNEVLKDERMIDLGFDHAARAAGIQVSALIPLTSSGRILGYLQAANKKDGSEFNQEDIRILEIIAGQAAPIIENAELVHHTIQRAMRAEALRRITSFASSNVTLDEIFKYSLQELARLVHAEIAVLYLRDDDKDVFTPHRESQFGKIPLSLEEINYLPSYIPHKEGFTNEDRSFISGDVSLDDHLSVPYRSWLSKINANSIIDVPIIINNQDYARILLMSKETDYFSINDAQLIEIVTDQIANSIERSKLASQTDEDLRRRVEHLSAFTRISRELNSSLNLEHLLQKVFDTALQLTNADCGTIILFELGKTKPIYPRILLHLGDPSGDELHPLERAVLENGEPVIIKDFLDSDEVDNQIKPFHENIRSALITPIAYQDNVAGLIHLHAKDTHKFDQTALEIAQSLSIQAAIALGNAQRYQEKIKKNILLSRRVEALNELFETSRSLNLEKPIEQTLEDIAYGIQSATPFDVILISIFNHEDNCLHRITGAGLPLEALNELRAHQQNWESIQDLLIPEFRFGRSYFIPYERMPVLPENIHSFTVLPKDNQAEEQGNAWHPEDALLVPLESANGDPLGLISVDAPRDGNRPDIPTIETLEIFASQAALTIESHQRIGVLKSEIARISEKLQLIQQSNEQKDEQLKNLAQESLKTKTIYDDTKTLVERMNGVMAIAADLIHQADRSSALICLGKGLKQSLELDYVLIAESRLDGPHLLEVFGEAPSKHNLDALIGQRNPIIQSINSDSNLLVADISGDDRWLNSPLIRTLSARGFIALTISPRTERTIVALGLNKSPLEPFSKNEGDLFHHFSQQIASIIQNLKNKKIAETKLREVNLLLDFSQILENLDTGSILETMVGNILKVIPGASTAMVALWDEDLKFLIPKVSNGYANNDALLNMRIQKGEAILGRVFDSGESHCIDDVNFTIDYDFSEDNLLHYKDATEGNIPISTLCVPIKSNINQTIGVLLVDNHHISRAYPSEDQVTVNSIAQLTALMMDYENVYKTTHQRANQLQVLTDLSTTISASLHPDELTQSLLDKLGVILPFHTGTLWMIDGNKLVINATRGFDEDEKLIGVTTSIDDSELLRLMINSGKGMLIGDMASDHRFPSLEQRICHSWLGMPMISKGDVIGVIALENKQKHFYSGEHLQLASIFAGQAAIAIENARLYQSSQLNAKELDKRSKHLKRIYNFSKEVSSSLDLKKILQISLREIEKFVTADTISIVFLDELENLESSKRRLNLMAENPAIEAELPLTIPYAPIFNHLTESLGVFITSDISTEEQLTALNEFFKLRGTRSLLILPLVAGNNLFGFILVQTIKEYAFSTKELDTALVITNHSTIAIQNALVHDKTSRLKEGLEERIEERTRQLRLEHQRAQALLRIMKELSTSLDVDQVLTRTLALLNETVGAELSSILLTRRDGRTFVPRVTLDGDNFQTQTDQNINPHPRDEALARWAISNRKGEKVSNLKQDPRWMNLIDQEENYHSAVVVPLVVRDETLGALQLYHRKTNWFSEDQFELIQGAANQIAISINNATLFNLIREQAEELGTSLRNQQVEAGRSRAILEAVADGVIVTDASGEITLFNGSAERILDLDAPQALGKSLELFIGLFSSASSSWMETIRNWSDDPSSYQSKETYEEHINLDNDHVVAVHLAPVIFDHEFFGTVSIFRDITHLVEVDRLKSDFVAQVSHELRTPMTSIKGYVDLMLMGATGELSVQQDEFLQIVKNNTQRLNVLVNDLLDISRIETGRIPISMQAMNLVDIAEGIATNIRKRSRENDKQMTVKVDIPRNLSPVFGDRDLILQILNNLITNAYNYTPTGGKIKISAQENQEHVRVNIQDNGIGIPQEEQKNVFDRFYRGENPLVLETAGTGLGLSIAKRLVELHKGKLWLESSGIPGKGCTFSFTLPLLDQPNGE